MVKRAIAVLILAELTVAFSQHTVQSQEALPGATASQHQRDGDLAKTLDVLAPAAERRSRLP